MPFDRVGIWGYAAGTAGTVVVPKGAYVLQCLAHSSAGGATVVLFNGASIPVVAAANLMHLFFDHNNVVSGNDTNFPGSQDIIFTGTDHYYVDWIVPR